MQHLHRFLGTVMPAAAVCVGLTCSAIAGENLAGVHWWEYDGTTAGVGPDGGWSTETIITHSAPWWQAPYFQPLYQQLDARETSVLTRVDYDWGQTVPSPSTLDAATWAQNVKGVATTLGGDHANTWIIGNEPNIVGEGNGWTDNQVTPVGYASIYNTVRSAIKSVRPNDDVLLAAPSPGGVIPGVRWMDGNQWLSETIDAVQNGGGDIDGFAIHAYGSQFATPQGAADQFQQSYVLQLDLIDQKGFEDSPIYITEWGRPTSTAGDPATNEAATAEFIRLAYEELNEWNLTPGNHNIVAATWFVGENYGGSWSEWSLDHWASLGNPVGDPDDLRTALLDANRYSAGLRGTRPVPEPTTAAVLLFGLGTGMILRRRRRS